MSDAGASSAEDEILERPSFKKFVRMRDVGVPVSSIVLQMRTLEGLSEEVIDAFARAMERKSTPDGGSSQTQKNATPAGSTLSFMQLKRVLLLQASVPDSEVHSCSSKDALLKLAAQSGVEPSLVGAAVLPVPATKGQSSDEGSVKGKKKVK